MKPAKIPAKPKLGKPPKEVSTAQVLAGLCKKAINVRVGFFILHACLCRGDPARHALLALWHTNMHFALFFQTTAVVTDNFELVVCISPSK